MTTYTNVIPIRRSIEEDIRFSRDLVRVLNADADQIRDEAYAKGHQKGVKIGYQKGQREGRNVGRLEGMLIAAGFVIVPLVLVNFWIL